MYSIGEVAKMFNVSISTLRFYDKEGLLLNLEKTSSGVRKFNDKNIESLRVIECLKKSGLQIKDIKNFMYLCSLGDETIKERLDLFLKQKENVENKIKELENSLNMINFKCWYYSEAMKDKTEKRVKKITLNDMPKEIKNYYEKAHIK